MSLLVAHQGGWDETVMVLVPLVILAGLLRVANGRAKAKLAEQREAEASAAPGEPVEDS